MAINFPSSPTTNQQYTYGTQTWYWDGTGWALIPAAATLTSVNSNVSPTYRSIVSVVTYSATPTVNWTGVDVARITLTGACTPTFSGGVDGQKCLLELIQDGTGGRVTTWTSANVRYGANITAITSGLTASKKDRIGFIYDASANKYDVIAVATGY